MTPFNREWKTFSLRWAQDGRLNRYVGWSMLVHAVILASVGLVAGLLYREVQQATAQAEQQQQQQVQAEQEKKAIVEEAQAEAKLLFKEEVAREQLRKFFDEVTSGHVPGAMAEEYWDELMADLDPDLAGLAEGLEKDAFDPAQAAKEVQAIKEKLVQKLAEMIARNQQKPLRDEGVARAAEQAKQLAEALKKELAAKAGHPAGEDLNKMVEGAGVEAAKRLQQAGKDVAAGLAAAEKAADALDKATGRLAAQHKAIAAARDGGDAKGEAQAKAQVRREQADLLAAAKAVAAARASLGKAVEPLKSTAPAAAAEVKKGDTDSGKAQDKAQAAAKAAGAAKADDAAASARAAGEELQRSIVALKKAQDEIEKQLKAPRLADRLAALLEAEAIRNGKLTQKADEKFAQLVKDKILPAVLQKADLAIERQFKGDKAAAAAVKAAVQKELEKVLGKDLARQVKPGEQVARAAGEKLPALPKAEPGTLPPPARMPADAEAKMLAALERNVAAAVDAGLKQLPAFNLKAGAEGTAQRAALQKRLEGLKNQLASGRTDFLGQTDAAALAAARARQLDRHAALASLGQGTGLRLDLESYKKVAEAMKERGRVAGEDLLRKGATGEVMRAEDDRTLRPALVSLPEVVKAGPETTAPERKLAPPGFRTNNFAGMPFLAADAIKIDGDLSDWKDIPSLQLTPVTLGGSKPAVIPEHQTAWIAYSPRGIHIAVQVADTTGKLENHHPLGSFWLNDGIEIYLDTLNSKYNNRGETSTHQFFAFPTGHKDDATTGGYESHFFLNDKQQLESKIVPHSQEAMPRAGKAAEDGKSWTMEILIPRERLRQGDSKPGRIVGFNLQIDTGSGVYYFWTNPIKGRISMKPNAWGDIQFLGSDAKVEIVGADGKEVLRSILPGQAFRVRVTDPDMNLDERKKDKISVTVRTATGSTETMILEETGLETGVFVGAMPTRLNIGKRQQGRLDVFEGETVTVEYLDQVRAYGERNLPVRATFQVQSMGTKLAGK